MKHLLFLLFLFLGMNIANANTLTGRIVIVRDTSKSDIQVCMNGSCTLVAPNGSYSLEVPTDAISSKATTVNSLRREGSLLYASGAVQVVNLQGATVLSGSDRLDLASLPSGQYVAINGHHALKINTTMGRQVSFTSSSVSNGVSARTQDATLGNAYIIVNGDTLREIKVTSWNLPTNYMIQMKHEISTYSSDSSLSTELVYWTNDSLAYVVDINKLPDMDTVRNRDIYIAYDSAMYVNNKLMYSFFYRLCEGDTIKKYTKVFRVNSQNSAYPSLGVSYWKTVSDTSKSIYTVISHDTVFPSVLTSTAKNIVPSHWVLADSVMNLFDSLGAYDDTILHGTYNNGTWDHDTILAVYHIIVYKIADIDSSDWKIEGIHPKSTINNISYYQGVDTAVIDSIDFISSMFTVINGIRFDSDHYYLLKTVLELQGRWKNATISHVDYRTYLKEDAALLKH